MSRPYRPKTRHPAALDEPQERRDAVEELSFEDDERRGRIGDERPEAEVKEEFPLKRLREAGLTGASMPDHHPTADDLSAETLIDEDGARSPHELGHGSPTDQKLRIVDEDEIGGGSGLDEAELARTDPLDSARYRTSGAAKPGASGKK
ncbi:MAG: serine kinase/phosphatase [Pseudomonas sp.]